MSNSASSIMSETGLRLCSRCLRPRPITEFRLRRKGQPHRQRIFSACHAVTSRGYRAAKRSRRAQATIRRFVCDVKAATTSEHAGLLVAMVEKELGGAQQMVQAWMDHFHAVNVKRGGRRVMDFFAAVTRLSVACAELHPQPDFNAMNDADLRESLDRLLSEHLTENLPTILETLIDQGWTVEPPSNSEGAPRKSNEAGTTARSLV